MSAIEQPLVSIITVVRNGMPFLAETLDSVAAQDYPRLEYWIIDGGSTDGGLELVQARAATLAGWISEPDSGIAEGFNKGLARARGDYISFLNADDALASPTVISELIAAARALGWPPILHGDCDVVDRQTGAPQRRYVYEFTPARFLRFVIPPHPGMLMHRDFFARYGRFDTSFRIAMDYELQLRAFPAVRAQRVPVVTTRVRTGGTSTRDPMESIDEGVRALRMTGHLRSGLHEAVLRAYYRLRFTARRLLQALRLYDKFVELRWRRPDRP